MNDNVLVARIAKHGDHDAFEALIRRHIGLIRQVIHRLLPFSPEERQDVEQEILAGLFLDLARFRGRSSLATFLYRYTRNKTVTHIRSEARHRKRLERHGQLEAASTIPEDPVRLAEGAWHRDTLRELTRRLRPDESKLIALRFVEEKTIREIASILGVPDGTVKSRLNRVLRKLSKQMASHVPAGSPSPRVALLENWS